MCGAPAEPVRPESDGKSRFEPDDDLEFYYKRAGGDADILSTDDEADDQDEDG